MEVQLLLLEDDDLDSILAREHLADVEGLEIQVARVRTVAELRSALTIRGFDLLLLDQQLPDGTGLQAAREVLEVRPNTPIIMLSASGDPAVDHAAEELGVSAYISKRELDSVALGRAIRYALRQRDLRHALHHSVALYRSLARALPDLAVLAFDESLRVVVAEGEGLAGLGLRGLVVEGRHIDELVPREVKKDWLRAARGVLGGESTQLMHDAPDDRRYELRFIPLRDELVDGLAGMVVAVDLTKHLDALSSMRSAQERFRSTFEDAPIGMALTAIDGRILSVNLALAVLSGYDRDTLEGAGVELLLHDDERAADNEVLMTVLSGETASASYETRIVHARGDTRWVQVHTSVVHDDEGKPMHLLRQFEDITERREFAERLEHMALHDSLTGLLNRRGFDDELAGHVARCRRYGADGALLVLDLDHFKRVNDTLGHHAGDGLIAAVARLLRSRLRATDVLARLGGDEFAVMIPRGGVEEARRVGAALLRALSEEAAESLGVGRRRPVTGSIGIAPFTDDATPQDVLAAADLAMYDAKDGGRDQLAVSAAPLRESRVQSRISWADRIERALDEERLELWAQPIVDFRTGEAAHQELLLRMREENRVVPPAAFLEVAERFGFIEAIDTWVVNGAVDLLARCPRLILEVNVSGPSMASDSFHRTVDRVVGHGDIDPTHLIFEVTETAAIANIAQAKRFADQLRHLGCRFALDDFGAGFGSFYYLKHLPFDFLKIDGEFVRNYLSNRTDRVLVDAVVGLAQQLGKRTIAEFVTDAEIAMALAARGVDFGQGHHLGAPSPSAELLSPAT